MKCYVITKGDPQRFRVVPLIRRYGWLPTFVCHTDDHRKTLMSLGVSPKLITVSGVEEGVSGAARQRDFVCREAMPRGEWCVWLDDNVRDVTGLDPAVSVRKVDFDKDPVPDTFDSWRSAFAGSLERRQLDKHIEDTIEMAERAGTIFAASATAENYYFRSRKWQRYGYCRTQLAFYKNDGSSWYPFDSLMFEDMYKTLDVVARYGSVVVNHHIKAQKPQFEGGGIGGFARRLPFLQENCRRMSEMYPGLVKLTGNGVQYGFPEARDFHLTFAKRTKSTVDLWRRRNGYAAS